MFKGTFSVAVKQKMFQKTNTNRCYNSENELNLKNN